jgi:hypothetical protein
VNGGLDTRKGKLDMKTLVSIALGAAMLFGAATMGLQSGTASAHVRTQHSKHHHHHHKHHPHHKNKLSY